MTPDQKHEWIKAWVRKWCDAERSLVEVADLLSDGSVGHIFRLYSDCHLAKAIESARETYTEEGKKIEAKLLAELREIESMIEVKQ